MKLVSSMFSLLFKSHIFLLHASLGPANLVLISVEQKPSLVNTLSKIMMIMIIIIIIIIIITIIITNSMAHGTRRFNATFTRALQ